MFNRPKTIMKLYWVGSLFILAITLLVSPLTLAFGESVRVMSGGTITVQNSTGKPCPAGIIITGLQQFADPKGIERQGHRYYFFESVTSLTNLKGAASLQASGSSPMPASGNAMTAFQPMGTAVLPLNVPTAGIYYFHVRMLPYGNSQPTLALSVGTHAIGKAKGCGWCFAGQINLSAGHHEIVLTEAGTDDPTIPSARLAALDCISISTNPMTPLWHDVTASTSDPKNAFWLNRVGIPARNPMLLLGGQQVGITASLDDGQVAIFYSDGTMAGMNLRKDLLSEDEKGLTIDAHIYLFYDLSDGGKAIAGASSQLCVPYYGSIRNLNRNDFVVLLPGGIWEYQLKVPRKGSYRIAARVGMHGNSPPSFRFFLDGREFGEYHGSHWSWLVLATTELKAGRHTLRFQESGKVPGDNVNMVGLDCLELTTNPEGRLYNELDTNPSDPTDQDWLKRVTRPVDDQVKELSGGPLILNPGENKATYSCASVSSPDALVEIIPRKTVPLAVSPSKITPNDDGYEDMAVISTSTNAPRNETVSAELTDVTGKVVCKLPTPQAQTNGGYRFSWDGRPPEGKPVPDATYIVRAYVGDDLVGLGIIRTEAKTPKIASVRPERFSPNGDKVNDTTTVSFRFFKETTATLRVLDKSGNPARQWPAKKYASGSYNELWDGKDDAGNVVPDGEYLVQAVDDESIEQWHTSTRTRTDRSWSEPKEPINFFPIGVWMGSGEPTEDVLKRLSEDGFNTVSEVNSKEKADLCGKYDIRFITHGPLSLDEFDVADSVEKSPVFRHSALLAYYIADEPRFELAEHLFVARRVIEAMDPKRVAIACLVGEWLPMAKRMQPRVHYIDVYPILPKALPGDFHRMYYTGREMVEYIDWARRQVSPDVPLWIILQCHEFEGWLRLPSPEEIRCQTYLALAHGARGIFYFTYYGVSWPGMVKPDGTPTPRYTVAAQLAKELKSLAPTLMKLRVADKNIATVEGGGNSTYKTGDVTTLVDTKTGEQYIAVVNRNCETNSKITIRIDAEGMKNGGATELVAVSSKQIVPLANGEKGMLVGTLELAPGDGRLLKMGR